MPILMPGCRKVLAATFAFVALCGAHVVRRADLAPARRARRLQASGDCPCLDQSIVHAMTHANNHSCVAIAGSMIYDIPSGYGAGCAAHDEDDGPGCTDADAPVWCERAWCYVDAEACRATSDVSFARSVLFHDSGLSYSYEACGGDVYSYADVARYLRTKAKGGITLKAALPTVTQFPAHFKRHAQTREPLSNAEGAAVLESYLRNDSIPWEGAVVDYLTDVLRGSTFDAIHFTSVSSGTRKLFDSSWTSLVAEVAAGNADIGASGTWMTSERLAIGEFSTPLYNDDFFLFVPGPMPETSILNVGYKVFRPFSIRLWGVVVGVIFIAGVLNLYMAEDDWSSEMEARRRRIAVVARLHLARASDSASLQGKRRFRRLRSCLYSCRTRLRLACQVMSKHFFTAIYLSVMAFFGESSMLSQTDKTSLRLMNIGYGFFLMIALSAYTACVRRSRPLDFESSRLALCALLAHDMSC